MRLILYSPSLDEMLLITGTTDNGENMQHCFMCEDWARPFDSELDQICNEYDYVFIGYL